MSESVGIQSRLGSRAFGFGREHLPAVHFLVDGAMWVVAIPFSVWLRYDFAREQISWNLAAAVALTVVLQGVVGWATGQYRRKWRYGSFDEVFWVGATALTVGLIATIVLWWDSAVPRSVPMLAAAFTLLGQIAVRSMWRTWVESKRRPKHESAKRVVVVGAGEGGAQLLRTLLTKADSPFVPVALLDDDPAKCNLRISGVRVAGTLDDMCKVAKRFDADSVLIAVPSAESALIRRIDDQARDCQLEVLVVPPVEKLFGPVAVSDIRPVDHTDLLGRRPAEIDPEAIAHYIRGRRVLVTGAGGSIGSELCRQLVRFEPSTLLMLDRDESGLHATQLSIEGRAMLDSPNLILASIRDADRIDEIFAEHRPEIVFHAAALKHLPLLESHPAEGWKTNVLGTLNLLEAANRHGVDRFVNVSTDKAANPSSVLGWTKRITERLTAAANGWGDMTCVSVRFGNVLGSNGSVLKAFETQARNGGPITVTHREITRYFMTIEEASRLIVHAGAIGSPGEVMLLDMGEPVRILDVARRFAEMHEPPLEIVFTGLRPNEKLHEDLVSVGEEARVGSHPLITHVDVPPLQPFDGIEDIPMTDIEVIRQVAMTGLDTAATT